MTSLIKNRDRRSEPGPMIRLFVDEATPVFASALTPHRCLNATRILLDVMRAFNVSAAPMSVTLVAMNRIFAERCDRHGGLPSEEEMQVWIAEGAWSLGVDTREHRTDWATNSWAGHLVAVVQGAWLVDASMIQFSRPEKAMRMPDIFVGHASARFQKGKDGAHFVSPEDAHVMYHARLDDKSYKIIDGFQPHVLNVELAAEIANRMAKKLGRKPLFEIEKVG